MARFFVPYLNDTPASIEIKGHKLLLITQEERQIRKDVKKLGGTDVRELELANAAEQQETLASLAKSIKGGVVLTPKGVSIQRILKNLESELPWLH